MIIIQKPPLPYAARAVCYLLLRNPTATMIAASSTAALMPSQIQPDVPPALSCAGVSLLCLSCALWLPQVYELSATGLWVLALLASGAGLGKEVYRLAAERKGSVFGGAET